MSFWIKDSCSQKLLHRLCSPAEGLPIMSHWPILPQEYRIINLPHQRLRHPGHCLLTPTSLARSRVGRTHCVFSVVLRHARCSSPRPSWTLAIVQPWQNKSHRKRQEIRRFDHVFCSIFRIYIYIYQSCRCTSQGDRNTSDTIWQQYNRTKKTPKESLVLCFFSYFCCSLFLQLGRNYHFIVCLCRK